MALKVSIEGLRFRPSDRSLPAADKLRILGQRLSNPAVIRLRTGDNLVDLARIMAGRQPLDLKISELEIAAPATVLAGEGEVSRQSILADMTMIDDSRLPFKVAKGVVPGSLTNGRDIAAAENANGRRLRIPNEQELLKLNQLLGNQLEGMEGTAYWIWTETEHENYPGQFVLRHQGGGHRDYCCPDDGYVTGTVRFVEDR